MKASVIHQFGDVDVFRIRPLIDRILPLSQAAEAHRLIADNEIMGNVVLLPWAQ